MMAFLNVNRSLSNRTWVGPLSKHERIASNIAQMHDLSQLTGLLLAKRDVEPTNVKSFLDPKLRDSMPDPYVLKDVRKTSTRLIKAVNNKEKICCSCIHLVL